MEAYILGNIGSNFFDLGDYYQAKHYHQTALTIYREVGNRFNEAISLDTLSLIAYILGDNIQALHHAQTALEIQRQINNQRSAGYVLNHLGLIWEATENFTEAHAAFSQALQIRRRLEQTLLALDDWAGLARVALASGNSEEARAYVTEILAQLAGQSPDGIEFPVLVYLSCYRVLAATAANAEDGRRASDVLKDGYQLLQKRAGQIQDEAIRRQFLENVPFNRELVAVWEQEGAEK